MYPNLGQGRHALSHKSSLCATKHRIRWSADGAFIGSFSCAVGLHVHLCTYVCLTQLHSSKITWCTARMTVSRFRIGRPAQPLPRLVAEIPTKQHKSLPATNIHPWAKSFRVAVRLHPALPASKGLILDSQSNPQSIPKPHMKTTAACVRDPPPQLNHQGWFSKRTSFEQ